MPPNRLPKGLDFRQGFLNPVFAQHGGAGRHGLPNTVAPHPFGDDNQRNPSRITSGPFRGGEDPFPDPSQIGGD
jgi:hypothetical protein